MKSVKFKRGRNTQNLIGVVKLLKCGRKRELSKQNLPHI